MLAADVIVKTPDGDEERQIPHVSSQMKQGLNTRMVDAIKSLSSKKKKGQKVGKLKFKSQINTIFLKQYGYTHKLIDNKFVKIQGIKQKLNCGQSYDRDVNAAKNILLEGIKQIPYEVTNKIPSERREFTPAERETSLQEMFSNISCISFTR